MATTTADTARRAADGPTGGRHGGKNPVRRVRTRWLVLGVLVAWVLLWALLRDRFTFALEPAQLTSVHTGLNDLRDVIVDARDGPVFTYFFEPIRVAIDSFVGLLQDLIARPSFGRPVPAVGWLGVVAIVSWLAWAFGNVRVAVLAGVGFTFLGLQGLWEDSMYTLSLTVAAVVLALAVGIPLGVLTGLRAGARRVVTPVLDFMQTMPTFVYLAPLTLFFLIGPAAATVATLIYALPPVIRITAHAIRSVSPSAVEASVSLGATGWQRLWKVQLPLARRTIVVGVNQTTMAALSMATIAALIAAPGLGITVISALQSLDVGTAFNGGLAIVLIAIVLDRVTTAASNRVERAGRTHGRGSRGRRIALGAGLLVVLWAVWESRTYVWAARFPERVDIGPLHFSLDLGSGIVGVTTVVVGWIEANLSGVTNGVKDAVSYAMLNPLQALVAGSPWFVTALVVLVLAFALAGLRAAVVAAVCLALVIASGLWNDAMVTLSTTLVAAVIVMLVGVVLGVAMGRSARLDQVVRPVLDALQVMPPFVYLVPFLGLFGSTRFTAIVAAVAYASPVAVKLVADGIRGVPESVMEAAKSAGSTRWQTISKVQLPMNRRSLTLAANQGLIYVLSMVVVGGLVGAGALGYDVVAGFSQYELYGKGLAAGIAIVLLGIMLDRITQLAAARSGTHPGGVR